MRVFGRGPYRGESGPLHVRNGKSTYVRGPNAAILKYRPSLCHRCNTTGTQSFDLAYELFVAWLFENEKIILSRRFIDFAEIYGDDFSVEQCNLYKYFAKSFGCRIAEDGLRVPKDVVNLLGLPSFYTGLRLSLSVNEDTLSLAKEMGRGWFGKGECYYSAKREAPADLVGCTWHEDIFWLRINYWYDCVPDPTQGSVWVADSQCVYLGSCAPLSQEMRADIISCGEPD